MTRSQRIKLLVAFATVYLVWGSTYFAIRIAVESLPPMLMAGIRFTLAGGALYALMRKMGQPRPSLENWGSAALVGFCLLGLGNGGVVWAEQKINSGLVALFVASVPLWVVLLEWLKPGGRRPGLFTAIGVFAGMAGIALLVNPFDSADHRAFDGVATVVLLIATLSWAAGSLASRSLPLPRSPFLATGMEMFSAGIILMLAGTLSGEWSAMSSHPITRASLLALLYLITFGSLIGFTAYIWLLSATTPARATTYAFVNPIVALALGWAMANEEVTPRTLLAGVIILTAVAIILAQRSAADQK